MYGTQFYDNEMTLRLFCALHKISGIRVEFSGSGDSGSIDYIFFDPDNAKGQLKILVWPPDVQDWNPTTNAWETAQHESRVLTILSTFIEDHVNEALDKTAVDWYNNDGGQGHWTWDPSQGVEFNIDTNYIKQDNAHYETRLLGEEDMGWI